MACRFALPVSNAAELSVRANAVPSNTKSMTEWGVRVWTEWASSRAVSPAPDGVVSVVTPLLAMTPEPIPLTVFRTVLYFNNCFGYVPSISAISKSVHYIFIAQLSVH